MMQQEVRRMAQSDERKQPSQVPGEAEAPPKSERDPSTERAVRHSDKTEPVQVPREGAGKAG